jgi:hypothetical protein
MNSIPLDEQSLLPNMFKGTFPSLNQQTLIEMYKKEIQEYLYIIEKNKTNSVLERYILREGPPQETDVYIKKLIDFIWGSYCYHMGQTNYYWSKSPPPPLFTPEWLSTHLKPILKQWITTYKIEKTA